jgi:flagellar biosynthesis/type III secretory pathway protein FliH
MGKCLLRESALEIQQANNRTPDMNIEKQMLAYIAEARNYVKTIVQLTADLASQQAKLDELVKKETRFILQTVSSIILQVCPQYYDQFSRKFKEAMSSESSVLNMAAAAEENDADVEALKG